MRGFTRCQGIGTGWGIDGPRPALDKPDAGRFARSHARVIVGAWLIGGRSQERWSRRRTGRRCSDAGGRGAGRAHDLRDAAGPADRRRADARFHIELAVAAQSVRLTRLAVRLQAELGPLLWLPAPYAPDQERLAEQHREILVAVVAGDAAGARAAAEAHTVACVHHLVRGHLQLADGG
ncbi:FCD domain-containing protein [Kitasatospora aureofaciens]|uniref:FCD domain-containing protein n=1 Tax=Kitasatospora aureofaciens TaxID=1894 RepID=UPI00380BF3D4